MKTNAFGILEKHGYDFADLDMEFFAASTILPSKHNRMMAIGVLRNGVTGVFFARLGREGLSVISMRTASQKERKNLMTTKHRIKPLTAAEEAKVQRQIASDPDAPEATTKSWRKPAIRRIFSDLMGGISGRGDGPTTRNHGSKSPWAGPRCYQGFQIHWQGMAGPRNEALRKAAGL